MTDSPTPGRHRSRKAPRRRGLIGPTVSALSVLLAIGPVVWLMADREGSAVADSDATKVLNVSEDNSGPAAVEGANSGPGKTKVTVTATLPNGLTTTITPTGVPALGPAQSTTSTSTPASPGVPATPPTTPVPGEVETVTVTPKAPQRTSKAHGRPNPKPSTPKPTKPSGPTKTPTKTVTSEPTPNDPPPPPPGGGGTNAQEREVLNLTNQARRNQGCRPLQLDDSLVEAAGSHASDMVRRHYMDHTNPDGEDPGDRMAKAGWRGNGWGENIAAGYDSPQRVFNAWMNSDGHRANILNCRFTKIGIGFDPGQVKQQWGPGSWVQDFGRD